MTVSNCGSGAAASPPHANEFGREEAEGVQAATSSPHTHVLTYVVYVH
jgi:hypothetical protein